VTTSPRLVRGIERWALVALGVNFTIGAGIFGLPSRIYDLSGPWSLVAFVVCAAAVLAIALSMAEVGSRFADTGGPYLYALTAFGGVVGFEVGWLRWLSGIASFAANANLFVDYLGYLWPSTGDTPTRGLLLGGMTAALAVVNVVGIRTTTFASNVLTVAKLLPLLTFVAVGAWMLDPGRLALGPPPTARDFSLTVLLLVQAFAGFESVGIPAGEVGNPRRDVPFALLATVMVVATLYIAIQAVCIGTLPDLAGSARPLADAGARMLGTAGGMIMLFAATASIAGNITGQVLVTARTLFAMAERGQLFSAVSRIHDRFRTPHRAILITAGVMLAFAVSGTFVQLATISVGSRLVVYGATCAALPVLRRRDDLETGGFRAPAGPALAMVSLAICAWLLSNSTPRELSTFTTLAIAGVLVYAACRLGRSVGHSR
jgi:APA family basic amino acid/polyamine antiporter